MVNHETCPSCFMPLSGSSVCSHCGRDYLKDKQFSGTLPPFTLLNNRYLLGRVLGKGGFGVTYVAKDIVKNKICAIKEYMPSEFSMRDGASMNVIPLSERANRVFLHGRDKFIEEVKTLITLINNPFVVDIWDYFEQNNTAYFVMEYLGGGDLRKMAKENGGKIDLETAQMVFVTVASALIEIHKMNILHRDLSPENIILSNGRVKLIDFGAARNYVRAQNTGMSILLKPGFAPPEQYNQKGVHGPWSDVYALCATYYTLVSGKPLVDALYRFRGQQQPSLYSLGCPVTKKMSDVIERGMELDYRRRYKDFKALLDDLDIAHQAQVQSPVPSKRVSRTRPAQPYIAAIVGNTVCNKVFVETNDIVKIGRSPLSCRYIISGDTNVSRIHCYIRFAGGKIYLCDTSSNGTFFENGMKLMNNKEYPITPGTKFYLSTKNHMLILDE